MGGLRGYSLSETNTRVGYGLLWTVMLVLVQEEGV